MRWGWQSGVGAGSHTDHSILSPVDPGAQAKADPSLSTQHPVSRSAQPSPLLSSSPVFERGLREQSPALAEHTGRPLTILVRGLEDIATVIQATAVEAGIEGLRVLRPVLSCPGHPRQAEDDGRGGLWETVVPGREGQGVG